MAIFEHLTKKEYKEASKKIWEYIKVIQNELKKEGIKFNPILIGSSRYRLVTKFIKEGDKNKESIKPFDFDFNLILSKKTDKELLDNPQMIRNKFLNILKENNEKNGFKKYKENDSRTLKVTKLKEKSEMQKEHYKIELAIIREKDDNPEILKFDKNNNKYIWNKEKVINIKEINNELSK